MAREPDNLSICSQVEEVIKCAICWDAPSQPKILPCQHSFCLRCIEPIYFSSVQLKVQPKGKVQCPLCRNTHAVPKKGLVALPTDHKANSLKDIVLKKRNIQSIKLCAICTLHRQYTVGTFLCVTCGTLLCSKRHVHHKESAMYKKHLQVSVNTRNMNSLVCTVHTKEFVQYYCTTCEIAVCKGCVHDTHCQHSVEMFVDVSSADMSVPQDIYEVLQDRLTDIPTKLDRLSTMRTRNMSAQRKANSQLTQVRKSLRKLRSREQTLINLVEYHKKFGEELDVMAGTLEEETNHLRQSMKILHSLVYPISDYEDITPAAISLKALHLQFSRIQISSRSFDTYETKYFQCINDLDNIADHLHDNQEEKSVFMNLQRDVINSKIKLLWENDTEAYDIQFLQDGSKKLICTGQSLQWKLYALDFAGSKTPLPDYLEEYAERMCRVVTSPVTSTVTLTHRMAADGLILPFATIFNDGSKSRGTIETSREQISLCGIATTRMKNVVFTFMDSGDTPTLASIRCHSPTGEKCWYTDVSQTIGAQAVTTPYYVLIDYLDRIIISDYLGKKINIYNNSGQYLLSFPKEKDVPTIADDDCPPRPSGMCVDSKNNILVAFPSHHVVSKFTPNGDFVAHVVSTEGYPRSISLMNDRYLALAVLGNTYMYDLLPDSDVCGHSTEEEIDTDQSDDSGSDNDSRQEEVEEQQQQLQQQRQVIDEEEEDEQQRGQPQQQQQQQYHQPQQQEEERNDDANGETEET